MLINATVSAASGGGLEATVSASSVSFATPEDSVTTSFTFNTSLPTGDFATAGFPDHMFVVAPSGLTLTATSPTGSVGGFVAYGVAADPILNTGDQGFDELFGENLPGSGTITYTAAKNIDPSKVGGSSQAISVNTTLVKAIRKSGATASSWGIIGDYVFLHVLSAAPALGAIPPAPSESGSKTIHATVSTINTSALRSLTLPVSFPVSEAQALASLPPFASEWGASRADDYRVVRQDIFYNSAANNYSADYVDDYARALFILHKSGIATATRDEIAAKVILWGSQCSALYDRGVTSFGVNAAGQGMGNQQLMYYAAFLANSALLLTNAKAMSSQVTAPFWVTSDIVGAPAGGKDGYNAQTWFTEQIGMPDTYADGDRSDLVGKYKVTATRAMLEVTAIEALQNGPGSVSGGTAFLDGGAFNSTNSRAAPIAYSDRVRTWNLDVTGQRDLSGWWDDMYDLVLTSTGRTAWTGQPDQIPYGDNATNNDDLFTASVTAGEADWTTLSADFATETITKVEVRYSLDGYQWIVTDQGTSTSGTLTGLLQAANHFFALRRTSASGNSVWTASWKFETTDTDNPGRFDVAGTPSAASPVNTTSPAILTEIAPAWSQIFGNWEPAATTLLVDDVTLTAGVGYWSGDPPTSYTYEWQRSDNGTTGWAAIGGATSKEYTRTTADAEKFLRCEVTGTNATGSTAVNSNVVEAPAITTLAAGTLINTNFRGAFAIDYSAELATLTGSNATVSHAPGALPLGEGENLGALWMDKTAGFPSITFDISTAAAASTTYNVSGEWVVKGDTLSNRADFTLKVRDGTATTLFSDVMTGAAVGAASGDDLAQTFNSTFATAANTALDINASWPDATGGSSGGDIYITQLTITAV